MILLATVFVAFFVFMGGDVSAVKTIVGGVTVSTDGWENSTNGLGENKVFVDAKNLTLDNAEITTTGNLSVVTTKSYTYEQMNDGTFDSERGSQYTFEVSNRASSKAIIISKSTLRGMTIAASPPREYTIGSSKAIIKWPGRAKDQNDNLYDVEMTIDNISVYLSGPRTSGLVLFWKNWHNAFNALQEHTSDELNDQGTYKGMSPLKYDGVGYYDGVSYDVTVKLYKTGTSTLIDSSNSAMAMSFEDLDARDTTYEALNRGTTTAYWATIPGTTTPMAQDCTGSTSPSACVLTLNSARTSISDRYLKRNGVPNEYTESVTILSGLKENKVFSYNTNINKSSTDDEDGTYLYFSETTDGNSNLRITGTTPTGSEGSPSQDASRFLALVDARGFKYRWSGAACGTKIGFIGTKTVKTEKGSNADHISITATDDEVTWRETKKIEIEVDDGYYTPSVVIDGRTYSATSGAPSVLTYETRRNGERVYSYTFTGVVEDHEIKVNAAPLVYEICKVSETTGDDLGGAELQLSGFQFGEPIDFSSDSQIDSMVNNISSDNKEILWMTQPRTCSKFLALPIGRYTLREIMAPPDYRLADDATFVIDGSGSSDNIITDASGVRITGDRQVTMFDGVVAEDGDIRINKILKGTGADTNASFTINCEIDDNGILPSLSSIPYKKYSGNTTSSGSLTVTNDEVSFNLKGGEYIILTMPDGYGYSVSEQTASGYTATYSSTHTGMVVGGSEVVVDITNTKNTPTPTGLDIAIAAVPFILTGMIIAGASTYVIWRVRQSKI